MNKIAQYIIFAVVLGILCLQGCDFAQWISVDAPPAVLEAVGKTEMNLAQADAVWNQWTAHVESQSAAYKAAVDDANGRYAYIQSLINVGLGASEALFPAGAVVLSALTGVGGLLLKRPQEDERVRKEKQDSYNAGLKAALAMKEALEQK